MYYYGHRCLQAQRLRLNSMQLCNWGSNHGWAGMAAETIVTVVAFAMADQ